MGLNTKPKANPDFDGQFCPAATQLRNQGRPWPQGWTKSHSGRARKPRLRNSASIDPQGTRQAPQLIRGKQEFPERQYSREDKNCPQSIGSVRVHNALRVQEVDVWRSPSRYTSRTSQTTGPPGTTRASWTSGWICAWFPDRRFSPREVSLPGRRLPPAMSCLLPGRTGSRLASTPPRRAARNRIHFAYDCLATALFHLLAGRARGSRTLTRRVASARRAPAPSRPDLISTNVNPRTPIGVGCQRASFIHQPRKTNSHECVGGTTEPGHIVATELHPRYHPSLSFVPMGYYEGSR